MNSAVNPMAFVVDRLAVVKAQIAELERLEKEYKQILIDSGESAVVGTDHRASISYCDGREKTDWQTIAMKFNPSRQLITAHTSKGDAFHTVRVSARKRGE
jgi:hypothetical protein